MPGVPFWLRRVAAVCLLVIPVSVVLAGSATHDARVLWVNATQSVFKVSPVDGTPELELAGMPQVQALAVDQTNDDVWVYSHWHLWAFDSQGKQIVNEWLLRKTRGDRPAGMVVDSQAGNLWIGMQTRLYRLSLSGKVEAILDLRRPSEGLTLDPTRSHLWVAERRQIVVLDKTGATLFTVPTGRPPQALAYDANLDQVWVVSGHTVSRYDASGNQVFTMRESGDINDHIAPDGQGGLWAVGDTTLSYLDNSGNIAFTLTPFVSDPDHDGDRDHRGRIVDLVADPLNHTAWVADARYLEQYATDSTLKQTIDIAMFTGNNLGCPVKPWLPGQGTGNDASRCRPRRGGWWPFWRGDRGVHHVALYVDTIPPKVSITSPTDGLYTNHPQIPLVLTYSDVGSGVDPGSIKVTNDGVAIPETCTPNSDDSGATCTPDTPLPDNKYELDVTVSDYAGNVSKSASVYFTVDTVPPTITFTSPTGPYTNQPNFTLAGSLSEAGALTVNGAAVAVNANLAFSDTMQLAEGNNTFTFVATDLAGNVTTVVKTLNLNTVPPVQANNALISVAGLINGQVTITGKAGAVAPNVSVTITDTKSGQSVVVTSDPTGAFTATLAAGNSDSLQITEKDLWGNVTADPNPIPVGYLPPDPSAVATPLSTTGSTPFVDAVSFLYSGSEPIQIGVASGVIAAQRVAVIRGTVLDVNGNPLPGVTVDVQGHPELGQTLTRTDGMFDLAVNGGQTYTVDYQKRGYLLIERNVKTPWRDYVFAPSVVMIQPSTQTEPVVFGAAAQPQFVISAPVTDADGTRQVGVFIPADTQATMILPDGTQSPLNAAHLRITEYTVGPRGQPAMPALLPSYSAYTYAIDFQLDEAAALQAHEVEFSNTVYAYVNNFLGFPVGALIPSGWYDPQRAQWIPSPNGLVIKILGTDSSGNAEVDVTGNGQPASATVLTSLGFTGTELGFLATHYSAGSVLWRVPTSHFSIYDFNSIGNFVKPIIPGSPQRSGNSNTNPCLQGCFVGGADQTLGEKIPLTGISDVLEYDSTNTQPSSLRTLSIPITGSSVPYGVQSVEVQIDVAGQQFTKNFSADPNQTYTFTWNGLDGYGREDYGSVPATVTVKYVSPLTYALVPLTGTGEGAIDLFDFPYDWGGVTLLVQRISQSVAAIVNHEPIMLTNLPPLRGIANGWDLRSHLWYDPVSGVLHHADGSTQDASQQAQIFRQIASANGQEFNLLAIGADDSIYVVANILNEPGVSQAIERISPLGGSPSVVATVPAGDDAAALRVGPDGVLYGLFVDGTLATGSIDTISPSGVITPAVTGLQNYPSSFAILPSGGFVVGECGQIVQVGAAGAKAVIAGQGCQASGDSGDGGFARQADVDPGYITVDQSGAIYFTSLAFYGDTDGGVVRRISSNGIIQTVVGGGYLPLDYGISQQATAVNFSFFDCIVLQPDGGMYLGDGVGIYHIDSKGVLTGLLGNGSDQPDRVGIPAISASLFDSNGFALGHDGNLYIATEDGTVLVLQSSFPEGYGTEFDIPSSGGDKLYQFDATGKLMRIVNSLDGTPLKTYGYDPEGKLISITDAFGRTTVIERNAGGYATGIVSPDGQITHLTVNSANNLTSVSNPADDTWLMGYGSNGLLTTFTDPRGEVEQYTYDDDGHLTHVQEPNGGGWHLARQDTSPSTYKVLLTSGAGRVTQYSWASFDTICEYVYSAAYNCFDSELQTTTPNGTVSSQIAEAGKDTLVTKSPDGTDTEMDYSSDPRFGLAAPLINSTITLPGGQIEAIQTTEAVTANGSGTYAVSSLTKQTIVNGATYSDVYDGSNSSWTSESPAGRTVVTKVNSLGQPLQVNIAGLAPLTLSYDTAGRLASLAQAAGSQLRVTAYAYYSTGPNNGFLESITDPLNRTVDYQYDAAGRVTTETLPDGEQIGFGYDAAGNLTTVTPPGRPAHSFAYTQVNDVATYAPPVVTGVSDTATHYSYNLDRQLTGIALPDGESVSLGYDSGGRLSTVTLPTGGYQYGYTASTGQLATLSAPDTENLAYTWDGFLNTGVTWSGPVSGILSRTFDNNFRVTALTVDGTGINYGYDNDGLLTNAGDETVTRDPGDGLITGSTLGGVTTSVTYDSFGEPLTKTVTDGGKTLYNLSYVRDNDGRITQKTQTVGGTTNTWVYGYDGDGRLNAITENGNPVASYGYDQNGNRVSVNAANIASYDNQDRLVTYGINSYAYNANGELLTKTNSAGTTDYTWGALGNLTGIKLPNGMDITYLYDGQNRRIGEEVNAKLTEGFLYDGQLEPVAELDGFGNVIEQFVYGAHPNVPDYIIKGGVEYKVISNQVGSPVLIVNTSTGAIAEQINYDAWGNVISDSNPGFQPFGFAGGLYDSGTGLIHFGARDYDPQTGRWVSKDPILFAGGDTDLYSYSINDPVNYFDADGHGPLLAVAGAIAGAVIGGTSAVLAGDHGAKFWTDVGAGAATGGLAGLTFGGSLLVDATVGTAFRAGSAAGIEALREESTSGCINGSRVLETGVLSAFGDVAASGLEANLTQTGLSTENAFVRQAENISFGVSQGIPGVAQIGEGAGNASGVPQP